MHCGQRSERINEQGKLLIFGEGEPVENSSHFELVIAIVLSVKNSFKIIDRRTGRQKPVLIAEDVCKGQRVSKDGDVCIH